MWAPVQRCVPRWGTGASARPTLFCLCSSSFRKDGGLDSTFPPAHSTMAFIVDRLGQIPGVM